MRSSHRLKNLLYGASKGHFGRNEAIAIRDAATASIGATMPAKSLELKHTMKINIVNLTSDKENAGLLDPFVIMKNVKDAESLAIDILTFLTGISL